MKKQVLIISASPRKGGNSDTLCEQFRKGAEEAGNQVEKLRLSELKIDYCSACYACKKIGVIWNVCQERRKWVLYMAQELGSSAIFRRILLCRKHTKWVNKCRY